MPEAVRKNRPVWTGRTRGGFAGNWFFIRILRLFGLRAAYLLLVPVSFYFILFAPRALKASMDYLRRRFGSRLPILIVKSYRHFFCFGQVLLDRIAMADEPGRFEVKEEGLSHILDAAAENKGLVLLSAHAGGWEAAMSLLDKKKLPVNVVMFKGEAENIRKLIERSAQTEKIRILGVSGSPEDSLAIVAALNRGEVVAMHGDRTLGGRTASLPLLGALADLPLWPYAVAAAAGAPLIHTFAARTGSYSYRLKAWPPVKPRLDRSPGEKEPLRKYALDYISHLEEFLAEYPFQWFNFYPFWKS
jgi:predicted LPLAT superfamily acyltransferase